METASVRVWSKAEKLLLIFALVIAVLFDRLIINQISVFGLMAGNGRLEMLSAVFWLCYLIAFYAFYWERVKRDAVLWLVAACTVALIVWNFIFHGGVNREYTLITAFVIPAVLMAHAQWAAHSLSWRDFDRAVVGIVLAWFDGWFIRPFSGLASLAGVSSSMVSEKNKPVLKRAAVGLVIVFFMMLFIVPLLMGADQVFGYYVRQLFSGWRFSSVIFHLIVIAVAFGLFYSFLWNVGFGENKTFYPKNTAKIDNVTSGIVLGSVIFVYVLFCLVQFTYLFARAGLPEGMTFSEYAREGFAQTVAVCAINLIIFGVFFWRGCRGKFLSVLLCVLLGLTGVMLVSGAIRLNLYIGAFGMTWLRLISAWFIIYLAAVVVLCVVRVFKKEMPLAGICALSLLVWYVALGFINPDGFIGYINASFS